uniref:Uncharacterized protein n=1 Tax=Plectus sambesii TaxID=2011161 RepID=A0A914V0N4_9BILA
MEQLNSDLSNAKGTFGAKEKECDAELSKLRADVLEEKDNRKKVDEDAKDSQRTISKLRDQLTECRANTTELNDKVTKQEEIIQQLNQTILSSAKQTKTGSAVDEQAEGAKSMNQNGVNEPANNANIPSEKNADDKLREQTNGKEGVEPAANVASAGQTDKNANASKVEQQADKNDDRQVDSNARRPASGEGVQSTNRTATDAKAGGEVGDDSMPAPKQPGHVEVGFNKPDSESKGAGGADGVDNVNDGRNAADEGKSAGLANANADTADGERKVGDEQKADERQKVDDEQKKVDDEQKKVEDEQKVDDQEKPDGLERSENGKENAEPGVGRAPPREKDSLVG